jgi:predicted DNA binding CopG/RHH family protein
MRKSYDFSKAIKNPYAKRVKRQLTIRVDDATITYFKTLAEEINVPYQTLINMYLRDCAASHRRLAMKWIPAA